MTAVTHVASNCLGKSKCGECVPSCPFGAINPCGEIAFIITTASCEGPCLKKFEGQLRPCQNACHAAIKRTGVPGQIALVTQVY